mmetsp:Transcript_7618/g.22337  ORF Transcript_7618/g.22337 Transcript_7618/m.22337 type:complete len:226 (-) Transcript_7618:388-1065(-)
MPPLSMWKAVMLGITSGFLSTRNSSSLPRPPGFFCHRSMMEGGSSLTWLLVMRIFRRSTQCPMSCGRHASWLKDTKSLWSFVSRNPSGSLLRWLWERSRCSRAVHSRSEGGRDWMVLLERSTCFTVCLAVSPKSSGRQLRALCETLTTSRCANLLVEKIPGLISPISLLSRMICSIFWHLLKSSENFRRRLCDILNTARPSSSLRRGGMSCFWQRVISMVWIWDS